MKRHITLLLLTLGLTACGGDDGGGDTTQQMDDVNIDCDSPNALTYENFGEDFFAQYCNDCHGSTGENPYAGAARSVAVFDTSDQIASDRGAVKEHAIEASDDSMMPPSYADAFPSEAERTKLAQWLACGAP